MSIKAVGILNAANIAMEKKNNITWDDCGSLDIDNTSVNVGQKNYFKAIFSNINLTY